MEARAVPHTPPRLLIADQDPDTRALLTLLLTAEAYHVDDVASLDDAAARLTAMGADLILADGCCTSYAAFAATAPRIHAAAGGTPVLLLSALPLEEDQARVHGFHDVLPKPFDIDELLQRVRTALADGAGAPA